MDNFTTESIFYSGNAKSQALFELIMQLHHIQMTGSMFVHIIWVLGKQMIAQRADGLSWGDLTNGVMTGQPMLDFILLHLLVLDWQGQLVCKFLLGVFPMSPKEDWVYLWSKPHNSDGIFVWSPPPAVANAAVFQCAEAAQVWPWNTHIIPLSTLITNQWQ